MAIDESNWIDHLEDISRHLVQEYLPAEKNLFEDIWKTYSLIVHEINFDQLTPVTGVPKSGVYELGAGSQHGEQTLDALFVIGVLSEAIGSLVIQQTKEPLTFNSIKGVLERIISEKHIPAYVRDILNEHGLALVLKSFGIATSKITGPSSGGLSKRLWVERFDHEAAAKERVKVVTGFFEESALPEWNQEDYRLYIDERSPGVFVKPRTATEHQLIEWHKLTAQESALLRLYLEGMRKRGPLTFTFLGERIPGREGSDIGIDDTRLRAVKSVLHRKLVGLLDDYVIANKGFREYVFTGQFPYCWIREQKATSRLSIRDRQQSDTEY